MRCELEPLSVVGEKVVRAGFKIQVCAGITGGYVVRFVRIGIDGRDYPLDNFDCRYINKVVRVLSELKDNLNSN